MPLPVHPLTYVYMTEVSPFVHRAKYITITQLFTRASASFNQFVNPIGLQHLSWKYYNVYVGWLVVETTIIYFLYVADKSVKSTEQYLPLLTDIRRLKAPRWRNWRICLRMTGRWEWSGEGRWMGQRLGKSRTLGRGWGSMLKTWS